MASIEVQEQEVPAAWIDGAEPAGPPPKRQRRAPIAAGSAASSGSTDIAAVAAASSGSDGTVCVKRSALEAMLDAVERAAKCAAHAVHICRAARDGFEDRFGTFLGGGDSPEVIASLLSVGANF